MSHTTASTPQAECSDTLYGSRADLPLCCVLCAGKFTFASGAYYEGCWQHSRYHGQGRYQWPDGRSYQVGAAGAEAL